MQKLVVDEGRVFGARYWTVRPEITWYIDGDWGKIDTWQAMMEWTVETFGPTPEDGVWTPGARWYSNNARFYFRNAEDRDWFLLRWS